jgi:uncharacterized YccA/Bax inhibitor family protein
MAGMRGGTSPSILSIAMIASSNPAFSGSVLANLGASYEQDGTELSLPGVARKSLVLLALVIASAAYVWWQASLHGGKAVMSVVELGGGSSLFIVFLTRSWPRLAPVTAPIFAVLEGVSIGIISFAFNTRFHGIPMQAALATFAATAVCFGLFAADRIEVSETFAEKVVMGLFGLLAVYFLGWLLRALGVPFGTALDSGWLGFAINSIAIGLAIACLFLDFAAVESARQEKMSAKAEWYFAFSLLVTLVWLYLVFLQLLWRIRDRSADEK